jgi:RNA polymerase sigma-70 factor, ECF subfamily
VTRDSTLDPRPLITTAHLTPGPAGLQESLEENRKRFLALVKDIRPRLHRFCSRMTGSVLDGEDVVQETLAQAFYYLGSLKDQSRLEPWLFRIAHNKCVDFLRRERRQREDTVPYLEEEHIPDGVPDGDGLDDEPVNEALAALVAELPPMERASVLLKDVLDYRLAEIAEVMESTVGGVKGALHRGRAKLRAFQRAEVSVEVDQEQRALIDSYIELFNRHDWDGLRRLIRADARIEVVGVTETTPATYFGNYSSLAYEWKLSLATVDEETLIVHWKKTGADWTPRTAMKLWWRDGKVTRVRDYIHVEYLLTTSRVNRAR